MKVSPGTDRRISSNSVISLHAFVIRSKQPSQLNSFWVADPTLEQWETLLPVFINLPEKSTLLPTLLLSPAWHNTQAQTLSDTRCLNSAITSIKVFCHFQLDAWRCTPWRFSWDKLGQHIASDFNPWSLKVERFKVTISKLVNKTSESVKL